jgi:hypothetical protein
MAISTAKNPKTLSGTKKVTAKDVDKAVKARKQPMGKGPKGGRMPYESDGGIMADKKYKASQAKSKKK